MQKESFKVDVKYEVDVTITEASSKCSHTFFFLEVSRWVSKVYPILNSSWKWYVLVLQYYKNDNSRKYQVFWDGKITTCNCKLFEF